MAKEMENNTNAVAENTNTNTNAATENTALTVVSEKETFTERLKRNAKPLIIGLVSGIGLVTGFSIALSRLGGRSYEPYDGEEDDEDENE